MVNDPVTGPAMEDGRQAERGLAVTYAAPAARPGLATLLALDDRLGAVVAHTREPLVAQMRLAWWHDALFGLGSGNVPAEPLLQALNRDVVAHGGSPAALAGLVDGWELLLDDDPAASLDRHADERGGGLFRLAAAIGAARDGDPLDAAGRGWAMADVARRSVDRARAAAATAAAGALLAQARSRRWSREGRGLGALALLASADVARPERRPGGPRDVARLLAFRLSGR